MSPGQDGNDAAWNVKPHRVSGQRYGVAGSMSFAEPDRMGRGAAGR
jgi:hypothetical protein